MHPGGLPEGSELNSPASPGQLPTDYGRYLAFAKDPSADWTWEDFPFTVSTWQSLQQMADVYNADNGKRPDLRAFDEVGGKLIVWYGLADASTGQDSTLDWYAQIQDASGGLSATKEFARVSSRCPGFTTAVATSTISCSCCRRSSSGSSRARRPLRFSRPPPGRFRARTRCMTTPAAPPSPAQGASTTPRTGSRPSRRWHPTTTSTGWATDPRGRSRPPSLVTSRTEDPSVLAAGFFACGRWLSKVLHGARRRTFRRSTRCARSSLFKQFRVGRDEGLMVLIPDVQTR